MRLSAETHLVMMPLQMMMKALLRVTRQDDSDD
jgi:hypothetical protein